jgi:transposase-like protein
VNEKQSSNQVKRRRCYDEEFKRNAVELLERGERSAVQLGRELGVSDCTLVSGNASTAKKPAALARPSKAASPSWSANWRR